MTKTRKERIAELEAAMAAHPKGRPMVGNRLMPDPNPVAAAVGYKRQPNMVDIIRQQVEALSRDAAAQGHDSIEEANDFDVGDDVDPSSRFEIEEEQEVPFAVLRERAREAAEADKRVEATPPAESPPADVPDALDEE